MATVILVETDRLDDLVGRAAAPGLLPLAGLPLVRHAARAFAACGDVDRIVLAGPTVYERALGDLPEIAESLLLDRSLRHLAEALLDRYGEVDEVILWRANGPLIRPAMIEHFLARAPRAAALTVALVRAERVRAAWPDGPVHLAHTMGNESVVGTTLVCLRPAVLAAHRQLVAAVLHERRLPADLAKLLGVALSLKLSTGRATLAELARRASELLGAPAVVQLAPFPELTVGVRHRAEYHWVRNLMEVA